MSEELELEPLNPNTQQAIHMPPALVEAVQESPELLTQLTRGQLAVVQDRMVQKVLGDPTASVSALVTVHKALSDNAQLKKTEAGTGAAGAQVVINFIRSAGKETLTIDNETGKAIASD